MNIESVVSFCKTQSNKLSSSVKTTSPHTKAEIFYSFYSLRAMRAEAIWSDSLEPKARREDEIIR